MTSEGELHGKAWGTIARLHGRRLLRKRSRDRLVPLRYEPYSSAPDVRSAFNTKMEQWMAAHFGKDAIGQAMLDVMATERRAPERLTARVTLRQDGKPTQVYDAKDVTVTIDGHVFEVGVEYDATHVEGTLQHISAGYVEEEPQWHWKEGSRWVKDRRSSSR